MVHFLITTHGTLAEGILNAAELIFGKIDEITCLQLYRETNIDEFGNELEKIISSTLVNDSVIVFTDMYMASPFNKSVEQIKKGSEDRNIEILSGVNLPMILEALASRGNGDKVSVITEKAEEAGRTGIINVKKMLKTYER